VPFAAAIRRSVVQVSAVAGLGLFVAVASPHGALAQTPPQAPRNPVASECLAMAQRLPNARYASLDTPQFLPVAAKPAVTISYAGHSTYVIDTPGGVRIATDYSGHYHVPGKLPDVATMNRAHSTHYTLNPDPRIRHVLHGWADNGPAKHNLTVDDVLIRNVTTDIRGFVARDVGIAVQADGNSIFIFEVAGLCIGHLGHLHHRLEDVHIAEMGRVDILMVPIDGGLTMSLDGMGEIVRKLRSSVVLPMHRFGTPIESFMERMKGQFAIDRRFQRSLSISLDTLPKEPTIIILDGV
jgi:L-ascorbate metabolism protein UlaG (beta-lactamase superfamily)